MLVSLTVLPPMAHFYSHTHTAQCGTDKELMNDDITNSSCTSYEW